eukprot:jgi/Ulvmu1/5283/UM022_0077.1
MFGLDGALCRERVYSRPISASSRSFYLSKVPRVSGSAVAAHRWQGLHIQGFSKLETEFLAEEIFEDNCYIKPGVIQLQDGDAVVDIGSNVGIFGLQAGQIVGPTGRVISVEALPPTFNKLQENRKAAIREGYVTAEWSAINAAAGATDGCLEMTFFPRAAGWGTSDPVQHKQRMRLDLGVFIKSLLQDHTSRISHSALAKFGRWMLNTSETLFEWILSMYTWWMASASVTYSVPMLTLATIFKQQAIDNVALLKVDVEGAEVAVLQGLTPAAWGQVQQVVAEVHSDALLAEVTAILKERFVRVTHQQDRRMRGTQLHMVYASQPRHSG